MATAQGKELMLYNNKIIVPAVVTNQNLKDKSVIPAGRHRGNFIYNILRFVTKMFGEATSTAISSGTWIMERVPADSIIKAIGLLPSSYLSQEMREVFRLIQAISEGKKPRDSLKADTIELIMKALYQLISKYQTDSVDRLTVGYATGGAIGNKIGFQVTNKNAGCNVCTDPSVVRILQALSKSDAREAFVIENSINIRMNNKTAGFSTSDTIMTQKDEYAPLEYAYTNAHNIEKALRKYDPSRLIMKPNTWQMSTDRDDVEVVIIRADKVEPTTSSTDGYYPSTSACFDDALQSSEGSKLFKTRIHSILTFNDGHAIQHGVMKENELRNKIDHLRHVLTRSKLSASIRTYLDDNIENFAQYAFPENQKTTLPDDLLKPLYKMLKNESCNFSARDIGYMFGIQFAEKFKIETLCSSDWALWDTSAYKNKFGEEFHKYASTASYKDNKEDVLSKYTFFTTIHNKTRWIVKFMEFTKVLLIQDLSDKEVTVLKVQPGAHYNFYCKYLGILKDSVNKSVGSMTARCRYVDLNACGNDVFIEYYIKNDVDIDSDKLTEYNEKVKTAVNSSPIVTVSDIKNYSEHLPMIKCIEVNMWFNDIVSDIQPWVPYLDIMLRDEQVVTILKYKAPTLGKAVSVNGASAFLNGAFIPRTKSEGLYYFLLTLICLIPDVLRSGAIGTSTQKRATNVTYDMSNYIDRVALP